MPVIVINGVHLKPCPFCGGEALLKADTYTQKESGGLPEDVPFVWWAKCQTKECGISTQSRHNAEKAAALWEARNENPERNP